MIKCLPINVSKGIKLKGYRIEKTTTRKIKRNVRGNERRGLMCWTFCQNKERNDDTEFDVK